MKDAQRTSVPTDGKHVEAPVKSYSGQNSEASAISFGIYPYATNTKKMTATIGILSVQN